MQTSSQAVSQQLTKANLSKQTKDASQSTILAYRKLAKSEEFCKKNSSLCYDHIPMPKPIPQWNVSASTLRHSPSFHRFSSSERFIRPRLNYRDAQMINLPSTLGKRGASIGFGTKTKIPDAFSNGISTATKLCPFYNIGDESINRSRSARNFKEGKSFGLGWKYFEASRTFHRNTVHSSYQVKANPGPNHYTLNPEEKFNKIKMHERLAMFTTLNGKLRMGQPGPLSYRIKEKITQSKERASSLGLGEKSDFTRPKHNNPGPIYKLSGFCDKFNRIQKKLKQM